MLPLSVGSWDCVADEWEGGLEDGWEEVDEMEGWAVGGSLVE